MVVSTEVVARRYEDVSAGTPISVDVPAYEASDVFVYYGLQSLLAVQGTDYTVGLAGDFNTFTVTPTASLLTKINNLIAADATEENFITVRRTLDYTTEATPAGVRYTPFTSREFDRNAMRDMQLKDGAARSVRLAERFAEPYPSFAINELPADFSEERALVFKNDGIGVGPSTAEIAAAGPNAIAAAESAAQAALRAAQAALYVRKWLVGQASIETDTSLSTDPASPGFIAVGGYVETIIEGFVYQRVESGGHRTTAGGVHLEALPNDAGEFVDAAFGDTDASLQAAVNAASGKVLRLTRQHIWASVVATLTIAGAGTAVVANPGAGLTYSVATNSGLRVTAGNVDVSGLTINAPATFDGANVMPTYGVIRATGRGVKVHGCTLNNVPKVGIYFDEADDCSAWENTINGDYPTASFTGTQTGHVGVLINPTPSNPQGGVRVYANRVTGCVQGVLIANYGAASRTQGISIFGNTFEDCWNHAVYSAQDGVGISVTGNTCVGCQVPIALTGSYHTVVGNTMQTGGSTGAYSDETGISMRNAQNCVVANNTLQGESGIGQVVINFGLVSGGTIVRGNICTGNTIVISGAGTAPAIRMGGADCVDLTDNIISNNSIIGRGATSAGILTLFGAAGCNADGSIVTGNTVVVRSASHAIVVASCRGAAVRGNTTRLEFDAGSAVVLAGVQLSVCNDCDVTDNTLIVRAEWGTNIAYRGVWELGAGSSGNRASNNTMRASTAKLTSATHYATLNGSGIIVNDAGPGAPNLTAGVGSIWRRTDGGAGTSLYVKEVGTDAAGWVGK